MKKRYSSAKKMLKGIKDGKAAKSMWREMNNYARKLSKKVEGVT